MPYTINRFDNTGRDQTFSVVGNDNTDVTSFTESSTADRQGVSVTNCSATLTVYLAIKSGSTEPTLTTSDYHVALAPGADKTIMGGKAVHVWALNSSAGATTSSVRVVELK